MVPMVVYYLKHIINIKLGLSDLLLIAFAAGHFLHNSRVHRSGQFSARAAMIGDWQVRPQKSVCNGFHSESGKPKSYYM